MYIFFKASQAPIKLWWPLVDVGDPQNQRANVEKPEAVRKCQHRQMCWWKFYFILNILQYWMIKRGKKYGDWFLHHQSVQHTGKIKKFKKKTKTEQLQYFDLNSYTWVWFFFSKVPASECWCVWQDGTTWWRTGRLVGTRTRIHSKSLARQRQTAHLRGRVVALLGSVGPTACAGGYSRYVWKVDGCTITEITAACMVPSWARESSRVQHPWHRDKGLTAAQIDVKNVTQGLWEGALHSFY